jgi:GTP-binding protein
MAPLLQIVVDKVPPPSVDVQGPLQMQISSLDYSTYLGTIGIGRISRGTMHNNMPVVVVDRAGQQRSGRILQVSRFSGLTRQAPG